MASNGLTDKERFEALFYPGTRTLINRYGIRDPEKLQVLENQMASQASGALRLAGQIPGDFDIKHMQDIHKALFGRLYPWAGQLRDFPLFKRRPDQYSTEFAHPREFGAIDERLRDIMRQNGSFSNVRPGEFSAELAKVYQLVNHLHPFREGNGRTQRIYLEYLANRAGMTLNYDKVDKAAWNYAASQSATIHMEGERVPGVRKALNKVFEHIAEPSKPQLQNAYASGRTNNAKSIDTNRPKMTLADLNPGMAPSAPYRPRVR